MPCRSESDLMHYARSCIGTIAVSGSQEEQKWMACQAGLQLGEKVEEKSFLYRLTSPPGTTFTRFRKIVHSRNWKALVRISLAKCDVKQYSCSQIVSVVIKHIWKITYSHLPSLDISSCQFHYRILLSLWNAGYGFSSQENINNRKEKKTYFL